MEKFKNLFEASDVTVKANGTVYKLKTTVADKGDKYGGKSFHIIATPKDKSDIIVFKEPLVYVGNPGEFYLSMLGWTRGYDRGEDVPTQATPYLQGSPGYLKILKDALEDNDKEYEDITYTFPWGTKIGKIKNELM